MPNYGNEQNAANYPSTSSSIVTQSAQEDWLRTLPETFSVHDLLQIIPDAVRFELENELCIEVNKRMTVSFRKQILAYVNPETGAGILHQLVLTGSPVILDYVLELCPELNRDLKDTQQLTALDCAILNENIGAALFLIRHGAQFNPTMLVHLRSLIQQNPQNAQGLITLLQYMLEKPEQMYQIARGASSSALTFIEGHALTPRTSFTHPNDFDDQVNGNDDVDWAIFAPLTNLFRNVPRKPRMPTESLAEKLKTAVHLQLPRDISPWYLTTMAEIAKGYNSTDKADELMAIFSLLTINPTREGLALLRVLTGNRALNYDQYQDALKQFREAWKDFIILVKTHQLYTQQARYLQHTDRAAAPDSIELPYYSVDVIERLVVEKEKMSRLIIDHTARVAKEALHAARQWYDAYDVHFQANLKQDGREYITHLKEEKFWQPVEGIPSLQVLCQRKVLQKGDSRSWCTLFNREPVQISQTEHELSLPRPELELPPSVDEEGRPYIGSSMRG